MELLRNPAIITAAATIIGVGITLYFTIRLRSEDFKEQRRRTERAERREVYREVLKYSRGLLDYWHDITDWNTLNFDLTSTLDRAKTLWDADKYREIQTDAQLTSSDEVMEKLASFYAAVNQCRLAYIYEYQNRQSQIFNAYGEPNEVHVGNMRAKVRETFQEEDLPGKYESLREQVHSELYPT